MLWLSLCRALFSFALFVYLFGPLSTAAATADWKCDRDAGDCYSVFVVHSSWHAGLVLRKSDIAEKILPEIGDFPGAALIEFSWGDQDYFPDPNSGVLAALKAAFWSDGSVLHLVGFNGTVEDFYRGAEITRLRLSKEAFERLVAFIAVEFARTDPLLPAKPRPGLFAYSRFYSARSKFSFARTCNTWVAEALSHAGVPIHAASVITASNLASELADLPAPK
jgi:uncharacterized protein (TIGR02117 family)